MSATRIDDDYLYYLIYGSGYIDSPWTDIWGSNDYFNDHWQLFVRPAPETSDVGLVDMSNQDANSISTVFTSTYDYVGGNLVYTTDSGTSDTRSADRLTLDHHDVGPDAAFRLALQDVEFVDAPVNMETHLEIITKDGFETDGTLASVTMNVGHQAMSFTGAARDSEIFMGAGYDTIDFADHLDVPGEQFWSAIRRADGELDVYSLFSGHRVQLGDGYKGWTAATSTLMNYGEVEEISLQNYENGNDDVYLPGVDLPNGGDRGTTENIDLRGDGELHSDSFNLAYFNFIRYTSDNVWVGEATVHDGTNYSTPSDRVVSVANYGVDAPELTGTMSVIGQSRNGTHDLIVAEQSNSAVDGHFRLYTFDVSSELYNEFNAVYLGTNSNETSDHSGVTGTAWSDRVALYGFGGEDILIGGAGRDYLFGGESTYNQLNAGEIGNQITGGVGADYFGVGNTDSDGVVTGANATVGTVTSTGEFHQGHATDVIMDWHAGEDTLVVLSNGVAVINGLRDGAGTLDMGAANTIDLRSTTAVATSDQDDDGARGGDTWDSDETLQYVFANQGTRDTNSITNEDDVSVVNDGLIVARGREGSDVLHGSSGDDYLYGNKGADLVDLTAGGTDRVYIDTFDSTLVGSNSASVYVAEFDGTDDQVFVNKRIIDAFAPNNIGDNRSLTAVDVSGTYLSAIAYDRNINFLHDKFYSPSIYDTNANHRGNDGSGAFGDNSGTDTGSWFSGADGTTFGIGAGMFAAGLVLMFVPFMGGVGAALMASGTALGAGTAVFPTQEHENATFDGNVGNYVNVITSSTLETVTTTAATATAKNNDNVRFLDFFGGSDSGDGYVPVVEFTAHAGQGIYGYFALHSSGGDDETFVYLVRSDDHLVDNSEAIKIAEINGHITADDFKVYDGEADIYNAGTEPDIILRTPKVVSIVDQNGDYGLQIPDDAANPNDNDALIEKGGTPNPNDLEIAVELNGGRTAGTTIKVYDGTTLIFNGDELTNTENSGGNVSVSYDNGTNTFTVTDGRSIGTVAFDSTDGTPASEATLDGVDNNLILQDSRVNYSIELVDGQTGIATRANSGAITVSGGNNPIDGGTEATSTVLGDILNVTGTNDYINSTQDTNIVEIETIMLSAVDTNGSGDDNTTDSSGVSSNGPDGLPAIDDGDDAPILDLSNQSDGFTIYGSSIADAITGSSGNDTINGVGGADAIDLSAGGNDRVEFTYSSDGNDTDTLADRLGADTGHDTITGASAGDKLFVAASDNLDTDNNPSTPVERVQGFDDRDGDTTRLMYETSSSGQNMAVASATELLVLQSSAVSAAGDLTNNIAAALDSAFNVSGLDGDAPSASSGGGSDSSLLFAVQSDVSGTYWVGRYEDRDNDDTINGATDIEVFANVQTSDILNSFWLNTELAPQALTISLPTDTGSTESSGTLYTQSTTFTVGGLQSGNAVYYSLNGGSSWSTSAADATTISLTPNATNDIRVRQVDGSNYSPETTSARTVVVDTLADAPTLTAEPDQFTTDSVVLQWSLPTGSSAPIDHVDLYWRQGDSGSYTHVVKTATDTSHTLGTLTAGDYEWYVEVTDKAGNVGRMLDNGGAPTVGTFIVASPNTNPYATVSPATVAPANEPLPQPYVLNQASGSTLTWTFADNEQSSLSLSFSNLAASHLVFHDPSYSETNGAAGAKGSFTASMSVSGNSFVATLTHAGDGRKGADAYIEFDYVVSDGAGGTLTGTEFLYVDTA